MIIKIYTFSVLIFFHILLATASAGEVRVAVAANFRATLSEIIEIFERDTGHTALVSAGSSGKFYAQIKHGAPFDVDRKSVV